jgi:hypothetical protein
MWNPWNPYGMWGHSKVLTQATERTVPPTAQKLHRDSSFEGNQRKHDLRGSP